VPGSHFECRNDLTIANNWCCPIDDFLVQNPEKCAINFAIASDGSHRKNQSHPKSHHCMPSPTPIDELGIVSARARRSGTRVQSAHVLAAVDAKAFGGQW
jgi:hypothetical protein